jgi:hypothetical protein
MKTKIVLDVDADYNSTEALAEELLSRINEYRRDQEAFDENDLDGMYDYLGGCISAYQSVATMIGVPFETVYPEEA